MDLFAELPSELGVLIDDATSVPASEAHLPPLDAATQMALCRTLLDTFDFDWRHGRLDESAHPFTGGVPTDVRITTRIENGDWLSGLMATIHEAGHARFERGLPARWSEQPVGRAPGLTIHESQSLFFEMQIARSHRSLPLERPVNLYTVLEHLRCR